MPGDSAASEALDALEAVIRSLGEELAFFRRRALDAERRLRDVLASERPRAEPPGGAPAVRSAEADAARIAALEAENADLRARMTDAAERARAVASRMRFARQQDDASAAPAPTEGST